MSPQLSHFLRLVQQGKFRGCSSSERGASELAKVMLKHAPGLDDSAVAGAEEFLRLCGTEPCTAIELLDSLQQAHGRAG